MQKIVHIVGAGISGLAAAVRLANANYSVRLHEATQVAGGRCRSYFDAATSLTIDNGNHLLLSGNRAAVDYARAIGTEAGLVGFEVIAWQGLVGPAGMPPDVVKRLNDAFNKAMATPEIRERLLGGGLDPVGGTPEDFGRFIRSEIVKWSKIAKDVGAKAE